MTLSSKSSLQLRALLSAAILLYLASQIDMSAAFAAVVSVELLDLVAVLALVALDRMVMIARWLLVLRSSGQQLPLESVARIFLVSSFLGSALPASVGADALRAYTLSRRTVDTSEALASVAVDRLAGVFALTLIAVLGTVLWSSPSNAVPLVGVWLATALVGALVTGFLFADHLLRCVLPVRWHTSAFGKAVLPLTAAVSRYRNRRRSLVGVCCLSLAVQLLRVVQAYLLGQSLGITVPFVYYLVFMPVGLLMFLLPVSVAGFGLPQGVIVWLLTPVGVAEDLSFALSTLMVLTGLAGNLPGAWLYAKSRRL